MKEIIALLITSGGLGFLNLYIAQESDVLYFSNYNKEERLAWLSIFTAINYVLFFVFLELFKTVLSRIIVGILFIVITLALSYVIPKLTWKIINVYRTHQKKMVTATHLPPLNNFFQDIQNARIFVYDFDGNYINGGALHYGTEERQKGLSFVTWPVQIEDTPKKYKDYINMLVSKSKAEKLKFEEYTDYDRKLHIIKVIY